MKIFEHLIHLACNHNDEKAYDYRKSTEHFTMQKHNFTMKKQQEAIQLRLK